MVLFFFFLFLHLTGGKQFSGSLWLANEAGGWLLCGAAGSFSSSAMHGPSAVALHGCPAGAGHREL